MALLPAPIQENSCSILLYSLIFFHHPTHDSSSRAGSKDQAVESRVEGSTEPFVSQAFPKAMPALLSSKQSAMDMLTTALLKLDCSRKGRGHCLPSKWQDPQHWG